jgi:hypothetical protein
MATKINNINIPATIANRGQYRYDPPAILAENGEGAAVAGPYAEITWKFPHMTLADYTWWRTTLLAGAASLTCASNTTLVNDLQTEFNCTCIVHRPTYERIQNGLYINVEVKIKRVAAL